MKPGRRQHPRVTGQSSAHVVGDIGVTHQHLSWSRVVIEFGKEVFVFHPMLPFFTGMGIALLSSDLIPSLTEMRQIIKQIEAGETDIIIGTGFQSVVKCSTVPC